MTSQSKRESQKILWFRLSIFLTYKIHRTFIYYPNYPCEGSKWPWEWFLKVFEIKIVRPFFILEKFPKLRKIFFWKTFFSVIHVDRYSQYFLTKLVSNERYYSDAHTIRANFGDFAPGIPLGVHIPTKMTFWSVFWNFWTPWC